MPRELPTPRHQPDPQSSHESTRDHRLPIQRPIPVPRHRPNQQPQLTINQSVQQVQQHTIDLRDPHTYGKVQTYIQTYGVDLHLLHCPTGRGEFGRVCRHVIWPPASTLSRQPLSSCAHKG